MLGRREVDYEAQAAIELEGIAKTARTVVSKANYAPELHQAEAGAGSPAVIPRTGKMWKTILGDLAEESLPHVSRRDFTREWQRDLSMPPPTRD